MNDPLSTILNYRRLADGLATAGQPTAGELAMVAREGFQVVINLGLSGQAYSLSNERERVESLGLDYVHIPVAWEAPRAEDLDRFLDVMKAVKGRRVFAHCAANKRVSAFVALYRIAICGWSREAAMRDLRAIWEPNTVWGAFVDAQLSRLADAVTDQRDPAMGPPSDGRSLPRR